MQSSGAPYQGSGPHGQYADHTYDNPMGVHCPPSGYQGYVNGPYPVASPRPPHPHHHYNNHQMPPGGAPYRGSYAPPQNQYGPNQDMYRNHHSGYVGGNHNGNRNMPVKQVWGENNSSEMMPVYNHVPPRPQMMPNSPAMNVSSMRSPPHLPANMNPVPSPGAQHYRQMQSPGHSPQTWSQAQVPSPVMHHASRATPSPLPTHARSPGHSQPFSPPSATHMTGMPNMTSHSVNPVLPENCQSPMNNQPVQNKTAADPLHSLQKMVMLDQNADPMQMNCHLSNENCEQMCNSNQIISPHNVSDDSKDSNYATYFNLDENRLESEPQSVTPNSSEFIQGNTNEYSSHVMNNSSNDMSSELNQPIKSPHLHILNPPDNIYHTTEQLQVVAPQTNMHVSENQLNGPITHIPESVPKTAEPRLGNSAPIIGNSEHVPNSSSIAINPVAESNHCEMLQSDQSDTVFSNNSDNIVESKGAESQEISVKLEKIDIDEQCNNAVAENDLVKLEPISNKSSEIKPKDEVNSTSDLCKAVLSENSINILNDERQTSTSPSIIKLTALKPPTKISENQDTEIIESAMDRLLFDVDELLKKDDLQIKTIIKQEVFPNEQPLSANSTAVHPKDIEVILNPNEIKITESKNSSKVSIVKSRKTNNADLKTIITSSLIKSEIAHNPVKVVIHRIKTTSNEDDDESWQVPKENNSPKKQNLTKSHNTRNGGPQIILLSAMSPKKSAADSSGNTSSSKAGNKTKVTTNNRTAVNKSLASRLGSRRRNQINARRSSSESPRNSPRKGSIGKGRGKGRVVKAKEKAGTNKRKGRTKKNKKNQNDIIEIVPRVIKKIKPFNGPYVHLIGPKQKPSSITVINMAIKVDEKAKALLRGKPENVPKRPRVGHTSTLSPHYDAFNRDRTWLCTFCHKGSHISGLGDLYGPYYIKKDEKDTTIHSPKEKPTTPSTPRGARSKRRKSDITSDNEKPSTSKKSKLSSKLESASTPSQKSTNTSSTSAQNNEQSAENSMKEVWIHEDCAVWCQSISLMGSQIRGLDEAIQDSKENLCSCCKLSGATLGCWCKGCKEQYHFCCAKEKGCQLDIENFSLFCPKHKMKRPTNSPRSPKKSTDVVVL